MNSECEKVREERMDRLYKVLPPRRNIGGPTRPTADDLSAENQLWIVHKEPTPIPTSNP